MAKNLRSFKITLSNIHCTYILQISVILHDIISRIYGSVVTHQDMDGEVTGSNPGYTNDFKNRTYCSSACVVRNELEKGEYLFLIKAQIIPYSMV